VLAALDRLRPPLRPKSIASRWTTGSNHCHCHRQHLFLLPGDRLEGRDMQQRSLDCLRRCDRGWRRPWLAVAAGGAAMASSAGGDKKGATMVRKHFCHSRTPWGQKLHQFCQGYGIPPCVRYAVASRKILIPLSRERYCLIKGGGVWARGGGGGHGQKISPPSVHGPLVF